MSLAELNDNGVGLSLDKAVENLKKALQLCDEAGDSMDTADWVNLPVSAGVDKINQNYIDSIHHLRRCAQRFLWVFDGAIVFTRF